jgi:hypothetical protein
MNDHRKSRILRIVIIGCIIGLLLILFDLFLWNRMRTKLREQRPLVMIHSPIPYESFMYGEAVIVHASARETGGLRQIELWVDGELVDSEIAPEEDLAMLILHDAWVPETVGTHTLIVTAHSSSGVEGQASLEIEVQPGETAESDELGETDIAAIPAAGEEGEDEPTSHSPGRSSSGGEPTDSGSPAPADRPPAPGSLRDLLGSLGWTAMRALPSDEVPSALRLELLYLSTSRVFEGLHCYIGLAGTPPRWYPDVDYDQSTDESFASLGAGIWDVATTFSDNAALILPWDTTESLMIEATCVGLSGGGLDAVETGYLNYGIPVDSWDGIARSITSEPVEGTFRLTYRVTPLYGEPPGRTIGLDLGMPPPTDLRMGFYTLHWNYPEEEEIDGFRIFVNGELQWTEPPDARQSYLPYEWLNPPCSHIYYIYVDAFIGEDWSPQSNLLTIRGGVPGSDECNRTLVVEFDELETYDLSNDEDHDGWIGPVYGSFYVNEEEVRFSSACSGVGYCDYMGFDDFSTYNVRSLTSHWGPGPARMTLSVPMDEDIVVGFEINDQDSAPWNSDDRVCAEYRYVRAEDLTRASTRRVGDERTGCRVTFSINPTLDSPAIDPSGRPPRPELFVTDLTVDEGTGQLEIHIVNGGHATWPGRDLQVIARWPSGTLIGQYTFPELVLRPGENTVLKHPDLVPAPHPPLGACILLDPGNVVPEEEDYRPDVWTRGEYCRPLPDLTITDVVLDEDDERLLVMVRNVGGGSIDRRSIDLAITLADGRTMVPDRAWDGLTIEPYRSSLFIWEGLGERVRQSLRDGYQVIVDPNNDIAETDGMNNTYDIPGGGAYHISGGNIFISYYDLRSAWDLPFDNEDTFSVAVFAESPASRRPLINCEETQDMNFNSARTEVYLPCYGTFDLEGDETLVYIVSGELFVTPICLGTCRYSLGAMTFTVPPEEWSSTVICPEPGPVVVQGDRYPPDLVGDQWEYYSSICRQE